MLRKIQLQLCVVAICMLSTAWSAKKGLEVGDVAPDYLGKDGKKTAVRVGDHRGKVVVVSFFATWCPPCRKEVPMLAELQKLAGRDKIVVVSIDYLEDYRVVNRVRQAFADYDLTFTHDYNGNISKAYGVDGLPNMFIVGGDGKVAAIHRGYSESGLNRIVDDINRVWKETGSSAQK